MHSIILILVFITFKAFASDPQTNDSSIKDLITNCKGKDFYQESKKLLLPLSDADKKLAFKENKIIGNLLSFVHPDLLPKEILFREHFLLCWSHYMDYRKSKAKKDFSAYVACLSPELKDEQVKKNMMPILSCMK